MSNDILLNIDAELEWVKATLHSLRVVCAIG
jgi:hypothetical protein